MTVDPIAGVGCFVSVNGSIAGYRPTHISEYACRLLRHVREGGGEPSPPEATSADHIESPEDFAGNYIAPDGGRFQLVARLDRLFLGANGHEGRVQSLGDHKFLSDHPRFGSHFLDFERSGGAVTGAWFGAVFYGRGAAVPQPAVPAELAALQGTYSSSDPLGGWWHSVFAQGERLVIENVAVYRTKNILRSRGDYWHPEYAENPCERVRFEAVMNGVPQRLNVSGRDLWRFNRI
jgi:hypothetical protein